MPRQPPMHFLTIFSHLFPFFFLPFIYFKYYIPVDPSSKPLFTGGRTIFCYHESHHVLHLLQWLLIAFAIKSRLVMMNKTMGT